MNLASKTDFEMLSFVVYAYRERNVGSIPQFKGISRLSNFQVLFLSSLLASLRIPTASYISQINELNKKADIPKTNQYLTPSSNNPTVLREIYIK